MFSRLMFRSIWRAAPRASPRAIPRASFSPLPRANTFPRRHQSGWQYPPPPPRRPQKVVHYRYNPDEISRARPLLTSDQIFNAARSPSTKWILLFSSGSAGLFYVSNLEEVPVSGRKRFNCYSDETVEAEGEKMYQMIMQENGRSILPDWDSRTKQVRRVMARLIPASGLEDVDWEVHVINSPESNAFVIPGGKVFVYTGILPITKNDDGLAAVLGHEIAHNLARHAAESMSKMILLAPIRWGFIFLDSTGYTAGFGRVLGDFAMDLGLTKPASRRQESEADYIGLMMMAKSCYNPKEATKVWERMEEAQRGQDTPEWLSTHPSNSHRITQMQEWLPKAEEARAESECASTLAYSQDFQQAVIGRSGGVFGQMFR